ncbi:MAG: ATPase, T2SS/T4P/T4SS family [Planctomycetota bacterium]
MTLTLAQNVFLMSFVKPVLVLAAAGGWAWVVAFLDKDAGFFYLKRKEFNLLQFAAGVLGFGAMLLLPIFFIGYPLGILILAGGIAGYVFYRNGQVPEGEKWTADLESFRQGRAEKAAAKQQDKATLTMTDSDGNTVALPQPGDPDQPHYLVLDQLMSFALPRNADQIDLAVDTEKAKYRVHIDGVRYPQEAPEPGEAVKLIDYVKKICGMNLEERRRKQVAELDIRVEGSGAHKLQVVTAGSTRGLQMQINIDPQRSSHVPLDHLGFVPNQLAAVRELLGKKGQTVLVASAPQQGKTTTLYSFLHEHDPYTSSVVTLEEEIIAELEGVDHNVVPRGKPASEFNDKLGIILRSDPNVIMVSKLADEQSAKLLAPMGDEVREYVPIDQPDTLSALKSWIKMVGDPQEVAAHLGAVMAQRLVRRLCHTCRVPYVPDPAALKKLNLPADKVGELFRASGKVMVKDKEIVCPDCLGLGYRGRVGVFEVMLVDDHAAKYLAANELDSLRLHLRKNKMLYLQEAALTKVVDGTTDIKEVTRVMSGK